MRFEVFDLGLTDFRKAWKFQKEIFGKVKDNFLESGLIICQHYPVITLGRSANKKNILISEQELRLKNIPVYEIERGGDVTYHDRSQLIAYPVFNLNYLKKDIHLFLRQLEEVAIDLLGDLGVKGRRYPGMTGVWVGRQKIASVGIAIKNWITFHGLSINVRKDGLDNFRLIRPCGMDIEMTSLETILAKDITTDVLKGMLIRKFRDVFSAEIFTGTSLDLSTKVSPSGDTFSFSCKDVPDKKEVGG